MNQDVCVDREKKIISSLELRVTCRQTDWETRINRLGRLWVYYEVNYYQVTRLKRDVKDGNRDSLASETILAL